MGEGGPDGPGPSVVGGRAGWRGGPGEGECAFAPATPTRNQLGAWDGSLRLVKLPERLAGQGSWPVGIVEMEGIGFRERELPRPQPSRFPRFLRAADSVSAACCERPSTPRRGARLHSLPHRPCAPAGVLGWLLTPPPPSGLPEAFSAGAGHSGEGGAPTGRASRKPRPRARVGTRGRLERCLRMRTFTFLSAWWFSAAAQSGSVLNAVPSRVSLSETTSPFC